METTKTIPAAKRQAIDRIRQTIQTATEDNPGAFAPPDALQHLTAEQERAAELASDIILNGGEDETVRTLLEALERHRNERAGYKTDNLDRIVAQQHKALMRSWPEDRPESPEEPPARDATGMIRCHLRRQVQDEFDNVINHMEGFGDLYVLHEVLNTAFSGDGAIGAAFAEVLSASYTYVKVSARHAPLIRKLAEIIEDNDPKKEN